MPHRTETLLAGVWLCVSALVSFNPNIVHHPPSSYDLLVAEHENYGVDQRFSPQTSNPDLLVFTSQSLAASIESPSDYFRRLLPDLALLLILCLPFVSHFLVNLCNRPSERSARVPHDHVNPSSSVLAQWLMTLFRGVWQFLKLAIIIELREMLEPFVLVLNTIGFLAATILDAISSLIATVMNTIGFIVSRTLSGIHRTALVLVWFYLHVEFRVFDTLHHTLDMIRRAFESASRMFHNKARSARDRRNLRNQIKALESTLSQSESRLEELKAKHARTVQFHQREQDGMETALRYEKQRVTDLRALKSPEITKAMYDFQERALNNVISTPLYSKQLLTE